MNGRDYWFISEGEFDQRLAESDFLESVDYVAGIKAGLEIIGRPAGPARLPVQPLPAHERERFTRILAAAGQIPSR